MLALSLNLNPEFNDNDLDSNGYKLQNQKVKEYENRTSIDLKRNERDLDLSPYDMESADCVTTPKLDISNSLKNDSEAQVRDFFEPISHSSKYMESFMTFPNDIESVQRSLASQISDPPKEIDSFENSMDVYMDKTITECEPELVVCCKESNYHVVKDICVDEGVPTMDKIVFENSVDEKAYNFFPSESYENIEIKKDNIGINVLNLPATEESDQVSANHDQTKDLMLKDEDATEKLADNVYKEMVMPRDKVLLQELDTEKSRPSGNKDDEIVHNDAQVASQPELPSQPDKSKNMLEEEVFTSPALAVDESSIDILASDSMLLGNGGIAYQFDPSAPGTCGKEECRQIGGCNCDETQNASKPADGKSDDQDVTSQVYHRLGESSFSAVGPVSSRINFSGAVPYSGSISLRSDSSTTSTRSFAFPILQSEWNSSPVRMAKADRRHCGKQRGWRQGLLCCRF